MNELLKVAEDIDDIIFFAALNRMSRDQILTELANLVSTIRDGVELDVKRMAELECADFG